LAELVFSIIVPTFDRPLQLGACLEALAQLDYPKNQFEVIVVDDGGSCALESVVAGCQDRVAVKLVRQPNGGPAIARNFGASFAKGQFLAFTDDDCEPEANWLGAMEARLRSSPGRLIGGRTANALAHDVYAQASQMIIDAIYAHYNRAEQEARFFTSNNLALEARQFREMGGFHADFRLPAAEDREFCDRWRASGFGMVYAAEAVVRHSHRMSLGGFWGQHFRYGRGAHLYHRIRRDWGGGKVPFEGLALHWDMLRRPFREAGALSGMRCAGLICLSQVAAVAGYLREARAARRVGGPAEDASHAPVKE
jgi:glycosyltransferase involved in cell wall biosynthesis